MLPRTVVIIMCLTLKVTAEWAGSRVQVIGACSGLRMGDCIRNYTGW